MDIISDEKLKILEDNIENKRFGLRPVLENNPISTDQELEKSRKGLCLRD